jgi:chaperonin cofactor prefoldin
MKQKHLINLIIPVMLGVLVFATLPVRAQTTTPETTTDPGTTTTVNQEKQRRERITKRKAELQTKLTFAQQNRLKFRCKNAQTLLRVTIDKATKIQTRRDKIHTDLLDKLTKLEVKLAATGVNTTEFQAQIASLKTKIETFKTDSAAYLQAAEDTAALDCQADPEGFRASLEASRAALKQLQTDAVAIRTTFAQEIKPRLAAAKAELAAKKAEQ